MEAKSLGLTLFDILGYLLPGYVILFCLSIIEASYFRTAFFCLSTLANNIFVSTILAYFLGHVCYSTISFIKNYLACHRKSDQTKKVEENKVKNIGRLFNWIYTPLFGSKKFSLSDTLYNEIKKSIIETYNLKLIDKAELSTLETYILADSYVVASGGLEERTSLIIREGFYKSSTFAFTILNLVFIITLITRDIKIQLDVGKYDILGTNYSISLIIFLSIIIYIFANRYKYFNRMKINNTYTLFLAFKEKNLINH